MATHPWVVLREDDPRVPRLLADGWWVAHRSWGARLRSVDTGLLQRLSEVRGYRIEEAGADTDAGIAAREAAVRDDYPGGPTTAPAAHDIASLTDLRAGGTRFVTADHPTDGVVAVTAIRRDGAHAETDFTSVARAPRRRGLAEAVKATSILALLRDGATVFGTGGAEDNAASIAMNTRLGYRIEERWLTLVSRPA